MVYFVGGILLLIVGYFTYGRFIEKILAPDGRTTPAIAEADGVDYMVLPTWKNMMIQLLNIAGTGPVIGVIAGIKFGEVTFLIIPIGCILAGATHDFVAGMISLRNHGCNLSTIIEDNLGKIYGRVFCWAMMLILVLVVAVFINVPATLIDKTLLPDVPCFWWAVGIIFVYYIIATLCPVDEIIGRVYPFFALMLLVGTAALFVMILVNAVQEPSLLHESEAFAAAKLGGTDSPLVPMLFVTIACGIISGFHATQSPIVARTLKSEFMARRTFYGMMIVEGIIAMIWAGGAMVIYNKFPEYMAIAANTTLGKITSEMLGSWMGNVTVIAVIILAITSGDTALRSCRLTLVSLTKVSQTKLTSRVLVTLPLIALVTILLIWSNTDNKSFGYLWNYFAWGNQVLAASTLMACSVWLIKNRLPAFITLIPGNFMSFIVLSYIFWTSTAHKQAFGFGLPVPLAMTLAVVITAGFGEWVVFRGFKARQAEDQRKATSEQGR